MNKPTFVLAVAAAIAMCVGGCASTGYKKSDKAAKKMAGFRADVVKGQKAIDDAMKNLTKISESATSDPRKAYDKFAKSVRKVESANESVLKRSRAIKKAGASYFKQWEEQLDEINNPQIRAPAEERKEKLTDVFAKVAPMLEEVRMDFNPFLSDLRDIRIVLGNDLTPHGISAVKEPIKTARAQGAELQKAIEALLAEMDCIAATITAAKK